MGGKIHFISGDKSFELIDISEDYNKWFVLIERGTRFTSRIKIDEENLRWVCETLQKASRGQGNLYRRWGRKIHSDLFRVYQNYNVYGRYVREEAWLGDRRSAIIIPEIDYNKGLGDIAGRILQFLGKSINIKFQNFADVQNKKYLDAAKIIQWPTQQTESQEQTKNDRGDGNKDDENFYSKCLVGTFNDAFNLSPNTEVIKKWFLYRWKITVGLIITPLGHNKFLFEFPSTLEAVRIIAGEWFWDGRRLMLQWWSPENGAAPTNNKSEQKWIKAFGIPLHAWNPNTFRFIGDNCGGFIDTDEDTKLRSHLFWARICINFKEGGLPNNLVLEIGKLKYKITILDDNLVEIVSGDGIERARGEVKKMKSSTIASSSQTKTADVQPVKPKPLHLGLNHFNSNKVVKTPVDPVNTPSHSVKAQKGKEKQQVLGHKLDQLYYSKGPKNKERKANNKSVWMAVGPISDPCLNKSIGLLIENSFDPISMEIQTACA
nr:uncharacterized protein LOC117277326 [Nicotiana tomentosiformis]